MTININCNAEHPEQPGVRCITNATQPHADHYADGGVIWDNTDFRPTVSSPTSTKKYLGPSTSDLRDLAEKVKNPPTPLPIKKAVAGEMVEIRVVDTHRSEWAVPTKEWRKYAIQIVSELAATGVAFTSDEVWERMDPELVPPEPRALGPVMIACAQGNMIVKTGRTLESTRRHGAPVREWIGTSPKTLAEVFAEEDARSSSDPDFSVVVDTHY